MAEYAELEQNKQMLSVNKKKKNQRHVINLINNYLIFIGTYIYLDIS